MNNNTSTTARAVDSRASRWRGAVAGIVCAVVGALGLSLGMSGAAAPAAHADETGSITVNFSTKENGEPDAIEGAQFNLYKIGEWDGSQGKYVPVAPFDADPFDKIGGVTAEGEGIGITDIMGADADQLRQLSTTLSFNIKKLTAEGTDVPTVADGKTNADGVVVFSGLGRGLYLVDAPIHQISGTTAQGKAEKDEYVISSSLVALPNVNSADSPMDVAITAKATHASGVDPIHVEKVWKNDDPATRPKSIKVSLYMEGQDEPIGTETLSEENDWKCTWDNLPVGDRYFVVEDDVPDGYHVFIDEDIINPETADFTITNSKPEKPTKPEQPTTPTTPTSQVTPGKPARTGADIAVVAIMAAAAIGIAVVLILEVRKARAREKK